MEGYLTKVCKMLLELCGLNLEKISTANLCGNRELAFCF